METPPTPEAPVTIEDALTPKEPATMVEPLPPDEPGVITYTIYIPNFLEEYILSEQSFEQQKKELLQKDWLTTGLIGEIESLFPSRSEIKNDNDNKRDPRAFQHKIAQLFPSGRIFASFKQLDQAADMFLGAWAVKKTTHSKSIQCTYSANHDKKDRKHADIIQKTKA